MENILLFIYNMAKIMIVSSILFCCLDSLFEEGRSKYKSIFFLVVITIISFIYYFKISKQDYVFVIRIIACLDLCIAALFISSHNKVEEKYRIISIILIIVINLLIIFITDEPIFVAVTIVIELGIILIAELIYLGLRCFFNSVKKLNTFIVVSVLVSFPANFIIEYHKHKGGWNPLMGKVIFFNILITFLVISVLFYTVINVTNKMILQIEELEYRKVHYELDKVEHMYNEAHKLRHDIKQCVISVNGCIDEGDADRAKQILGRMVEEKINVWGYTRYCDNKVLNYVVNNKVEICKKKGIIIKCAIFGKLDTVSDIDISTLIGNLLDNAIEAAGKSQDKVINLEIYDKYSIEIIVENSIKDSVIKINPQFRTSKKDSEHHGYGMKSIYEIVQKYNGEINYKEKDNFLKCSILLLKG